MSDTDTSTPAPAPTPKATPRVPVKNFIDGAQARSDVTYSLADLDSAFQNQMGFRVHYGELKAMAERQHADLKIKLEAAESVVYREVRDDLTKQGVKVTEKLIEQEINAHRKILAIKLAINEAKQVWEIARSVYDAIDDRAKMLMGAGAKDRKEMEGEIRMGVVSARDAAAKSTAQDMLEKRRQLLASNGEAA